MLTDSVAMTGRTAFIDGLLTEVFRGFPQLPGDLCTALDIISYHPTISSLDTRGRWPLAKSPDMRWWHCHTSLKLFLATALGSMDMRKDKS